MKIPSPKGKTLHETLFDPAAFRLQIKKQVNLSSKQDFSGSAPGLFVGRFGYPQVRIGVLTTQDYANNDNPLAWVRDKTSIGKIISLRSDLVNAGSSAHVKLPSVKQAKQVKEVAQEAAMAIKPLEVDIGLDRKPQFRLTMEDDMLPHGPLASLQTAKVTSNPKIPLFVDKVVSDSDLKATGGIGKLWRKGFSEHQLAKLLSAGTLGQSLERRLVPTRWGITAVDDTVGKQVISSLQDFAETDFKAYFGGYQGNYFLVLCLPGPWSFELFENYVGKNSSSLSVEYHDAEGVRGRTSYASKTAGGYYAARLAVAEHLQATKRKGAIIALRFITDEYWAPLGVWVVREAVRAALQEKPLVFGDQELLLRFASALVSRKYGCDLSPVLRASSLLEERRSQMTLGQFN